MHTHSEKCNKGWRVAHKKAGVFRICRSCGWKILMAPGSGGSGFLDDHPEAPYIRPKGKHRPKLVKNKK